MKMGGQNWILKKFVPTPTGYCTEETEMAWEEKGENTRTSQPFKVPASEVETGLSKARPLLAAIPDRKKTPLHHSFDKVFGFLLA